MMLALMRNSPKIMVLETSATLGSVALASGSQVLVEQNFTANFQHAAQLLPTIDGLCRRINWRPDDVEQLYISMGPGSFTGLRIAITFAKIFAYAHPVKIVVVPSTDAAAMNAVEACRNDKLDIKFAAVAIDAKRKQIYTAGFELLEGDNFPNSIVSNRLTHIQTAGQEALPPWLVLDDRFTPGLHQFLPPAALTPKQLLDSTPRPIYLLGEGLANYIEELTGRDIFHLPRDYWIPRASAVHRCGWARAQAGLFIDPEQLSPLYLRRPEAIERWEKLHPNK
jgi:tRNA threonylcarbamoyladenosine biosynthesis protein TsaB